MEVCTGVSEPDNLTLGLTPGLTVSHHSAHRERWCQYLGTLHSFYIRDLYKYLAACLRSTKQQCNPGSNTGLENGTCTKSVPEHIAKDLSYTVAHGVAQHMRVRQGRGARLTVRIDIHIAPERHP
mgnify:CR=1 FL=1